MKTSWPPVPYFASWFFGMLSVSILTPCLCKYHGIVSGPIHMVVFGFFVYRYLKAHFRKEQGGIWKYYVAFMLLAAPISLLTVDHLDHWFVDWYLSREAD